jgi:1-phosphatidylinositol phosphodiesterase
METSNWMSRLDSNTKLSGIVMPGSHDAGMSQLSHCFAGVKLNCGIIKTQALNILQQLEAGSRYFDIRVDYDYRELVTYHRSGDAGCNGQSLETVLDQSLQFLQSHGSETFILKFSHIRTNRKKEREIKDRIDEFLVDIKYREYLFTHSKRDVNLANITLDDCRGKLILVFDYPEHIGARAARFRYHDGFSQDSSGVEVGGYRGPNLTVCDSYSNTTSLEKMKHDQLAKLDAYGGLDKDYLFLLSWTLTPNATTFVFDGSVEKLAEEANPALEEVLRERISQPDKPIPNIVYIDYFNAKTAQSIIQCNFQTNYLNNVS